eukprot:TRINITY_DN7039_c0_g2_i1.p1 TRINITY_DN7039_c0_g2~~TRINITY_DN7039_c0_g2_i1.p1  ORF type:complete len:127 (-),score=12.35 TRINITY_DN7039_c0_g2_i1:43-423(-)
MAAEIAAEVFFLSLGTVFLWGAPSLQQQWYQIGQKVCQVAYSAHLKCTISVNAQGLRVTTGCTNAQVKGIACAYHIWTFKEDAYTLHVGNVLANGIDKDVASCHERPTNKRELAHSPSFESQNFIL